mmetsp:Transcript_32899/g.97050  ORF Transcript_32899/g.97050 Transcript_32899/m.97050 type:complete len:120 (-) Transcript_32899:76-435(-)
MTAVKVTQQSLTSWAAASFVLTTWREREVTSAKLPALARSSSVGRKRYIRSPGMVTAALADDASDDDMLLALAVALRRSSGTTRTDWCHGGSLFVFARARAGHAFFRGDQTAPHSRGLV